MVRLLLKHNASVDLQSDVGHTALKAAKVFGHTDGEGAAIRGR